MGNPRGAAVAWPLPLVVPVGATLYYLDFNRRGGGPVWTDDQILEFAMVMLCNSMPDASLNAENVKVWKDGRRRWLEMYYRHTGRDEDDLRHMSVAMLNSIAPPPGELSLVEWNRVKVDVIAEMDRLFGIKADATETGVRGGHDGAAAEDAG